MPRALEGVGLALREELADALLESHPPIDWLELTPESWLPFGGRMRRTLDACAERWPVVAHGVSLSIAGPDPLDRDFLGMVAAFCRERGCAFFSDHFAWSSAGGAQLGDLLPFPFDEAFVAHVAARARLAQQVTGSVLLLENTAAYARMPGTMDEPAFIAAVLEAAGCGLLLDVNNVWVNARNHGFDPYAWVDAVPLDRVGEIHLGGHRVDDGTVIDSHDRAVADPVWDLYRHAVRRAGRAIPTLIEWDESLPALEVVLGEVHRARRELAALGGA
jgi:uncharacterized protein (UPF0276 family)